jgi:hypothetical protein
MADIRLLERGIFRAAMRHMTKFGASADLHLYHEVMAVQRGFDCWLVGRVVAGIRVF